MALETASYISQLVATNPTASDPKSQGDNHLRMVKTVLQTQFPNLGAVAVTPTATQINNFIANGGIYSVGTSVTSLTVGAGSKTFTTQTGRGFAIGQSIKITSDYDVSTFMTGVCTAYDTTTGAMSVLVDGVSGSGTSALWSISVFIDSGPADLIRSARTSNTMLVAADKGTLIDITSGTFSQTFDAVATLGDGWWCYLRNSGTGDITLDPDGAEQIDGLTSYVMYPGEVRLVQCDGAALRSIVLNAFYKTFTASGTFTKPPGYSNFQGLQWGGGGSGRKGAAGTARLGGTGAACSPFTLLYSSISSSEAVTIGAGGASISANSTNGQDGGHSVFAGISACCGFGGFEATTRGAGTAYSQSASGVLAALNNHVLAASDTSAGGVNSRSYFGGDSARTGNNSPGSVYGAGAGGSIDTGNTVRNPGASVFGGGGGAASPSASATDGTIPGGGGGAAVNDVGNSGAGARGELRIWGLI